MKLCYLLKGINCRIIGNPNKNIFGLYHKDFEVKENGLYFAIDGNKTNGEDYIFNAIKNGAVAVVLKKEQKGIGATQIIVQDVRETMSLVSQNFYDNPAKKLKIIGVTGTNGKTSTTTIVANALENMGKNCALIGTNGAFINGKKYETSMTTPDPIELQKLFRKMVVEKIEYVCMEVSAHAIYLKKIEGINFECAAFTNLTQDHLDFFLNMENYFEAKKQLFSKKFSNNFVVNFDDEYGKKIISNIKTGLITYSIGNELSNYFASDVIITNQCQRFLINNNLKVETGLFGKFNIYNYLCAFSILKSLNFSSEKIIGSLKNIKNISGRFNCYFVKNRLFIIDYAHTPDGLENVLLTAKDLQKDGKLICVFGCGGDRDRQKRAKMGKISTKIADFTIITSDNPRSESPLEIAKEIEKGVVNNNYKIITNRVLAIKFAFNNSNEADIILVAGKGNENYIEENGVKKPYSDYEEILKLKEE